LRPSRPTAPYVAYKDPGEQRLTPQQKVKEHSQMSENLKKSESARDRRTFIADSSPLDDP